MGIGLLPCRMFGPGKLVLPPDIIPVIHVKRERQNIVAHRKLGQKGVGGRTGIAPLRGEKFDQNKRFLVCISSATHKRRGCNEPCPDPRFHHALSVCPCKA